MKQLYFPFLIKYNEKNVWMLNHNSFQIIEKSVQFK